MNRLIRILDVSFGVGALIALLLCASDRTLGQCGPAGQCDDKCRERTRFWVDFKSGLACKEFEVADCLYCSAAVKGCCFIQDGDPTTKTCTDAGVTAAWRTRIFCVWLCSLQKGGSAEAGGGMTTEKFQAQTFNTFVCK